MISFSFHSDVHAWFVRNVCSQQMGHSVSIVKRAFLKGHFLLVFDKRSFTSGLFLGNGGHINPAVSLAFCTVGKLPWRKLPLYLLAQYTGAFVAAAVAFGVYHGKVFDKFNHALFADQKLYVWAQSTLDGTSCCEWEYSHWTQATSKELPANLSARVQCRLRTFSCMCSQYSWPHDASRQS